MNIPVTISVNDAAAVQAIKVKVAKADGHRIATRVAVPLARLWRDTIKSMPRNKHGWPTTGFWEDAARKVVGIALGGAVLLQSDKLGLRKRYYGGTTRASNGQWLTIPICREAYGTTVADWGRENLVLVILADKRRFLALWLGGSGGSNLASAFKGTIKRAEVTTRRAGQFRQIQRTDMSMRERKKPTVIVLRASGSGGTSRAEHNMPLKFLFRLMRETGAAEPMPQLIPSNLQEVALEEARKAVNQP